MRLRQHLTAAVASKHGERGGERWHRQHQRAQEAALAQFGVGPEIKFLRMANTALHRAVAVCLQLSQQDSVGRDADDFSHPLASSSAKGQTTAWRWLPWFWKAAVQPCLVFVDELVKEEYAQLQLPESDPLAVLGGWHSGVQLWRDRTATLVETLQKAFIPEGLEVWQQRHQRLDSLVADEIDGFVDVDDDVDVWLSESDPPPTVGRPDGRSSKLSHARSVGRLHRSNTALSLDQLKEAASTDVYQPVNDAETLYCRASSAQPSFTAALRELFSVRL